MDQQEQTAEPTIRKRRNKDQTEANQTSETLTPSSTAGSTIYAKLNQIQKEIPALKKEGLNTAQHYTYLADYQLAELFKDLCAKHNVVFVYGSRILGKTEWTSGKGQHWVMTDVSVDYMFVDADNPTSYIEGSAVGQGADTSDKGVYKAITGAVKYILMKTFFLATGDDAEKDDYVETGSTSNYSPAKAPSKPSASAEPNYLLIEDEGERTEAILISEELKTAASVDAIKKIADESKAIEFSSIAKEQLRLEANKKIKQLNAQTNGPK